MSRMPFFLQTEPTFALRGFLPAKSRIASPLPCVAIEGREDEDAVLEVHLQSIKMDEDVIVKQK